MALMMHFGAGEVTEDMYVIRTKPIIRSRLT